MRKRMGMVAVALALAFGVQGCYGKFALTSKLHKWNGSLGNKFVNEAVFLVCVILPVYGIASFVDAVIFNSVEFWSGKNPMTSKTVTEGDKMMTLDFDKASSLVKISYFEQGQLKRVNYLRQNEGGVELLDATRVGLMTVPYQAGTVLASR